MVLKKFARRTTPPDKLVSQNPCPLCPETPQPARLAKKSGNYLLITEIDLHHLKSGTISIVSFLNA